MSIGAPIIGIVAVVLAIVATYYLLRSEEDRSTREEFLYKYGAFVPYILVVIVVALIFTNM